MLCERGPSEANLEIAQAGLLWRLLKLKLLQTPDGSIFITDGQRAKSGMSFIAGKK